MYSSDLKTRSFGVRSGMDMRPEIKAGDWIYVDRTPSVVAMVHSDTTICDCMVVCNPEKPANRDVSWDGKKWFFTPGDYGGYADRNQSLAEYVLKLKRGQYWKP